MLRQMVMELFALPEEPMSEEDESDTEEPSKRKEETYEAPEKFTNRALTHRTRNKDLKPCSYKHPYYRLLYGGNALYVFFRVHHMICDRLDRLKRKCAEMVADHEEAEERARVQASLFQRYGKSIEGHEMNASDTQNGLELLRGGRRESPAPYYNRLLWEVKNVLDVAVDPQIFEDNIRAMFPVDGYLAFTMDKMVSVAARQLQILCSPPEHPKGITLALYRQYKTDCPTSAIKPSAENLKIEAEYGAKAEQQICNENCFKLILIDDGDKVDLNVELLDTEPLDEDQQDEEVLKNMQKKAEEAVEEDEEEEMDTEHAKAQVKVEEDEKEEDLEEQHAEEDEGESEEDEESQEDEEESENEETEEEGSDSDENTEGKEAPAETEEVVEDEEVEERSDNEGAEEDEEDDEDEEGDEDEEEGTTMKARKHGEEQDTEKEESGDEDEDSDNGMDDDDQEDDDDEAGEPSSKRSKLGTHSSLAGPSSRSVSRPATAVYLKRNTRGRKGRLLGEFIQSCDVDHAVNLRGGPPTLTIGSCEYFVRKRKRLNETRKRNAFERLTTLRRERAKRWMEKKLDKNVSGGSSWLLKGMNKIAMRHPKYSFLTYCRYTSKKA